MDTGSVAKNKLLKWRLCTANGEIKLAFDPSSMFVFVSQICETMDLHKYHD
jgi:hypothetical protein